ncbi:thioredoxin [Phreatobacter sp.]|uniref:thioredoxin n=1 Tax=Phreatobacter sp. TaxID=1966341 RepID=UPI003F7239BD
MGAVSATTDATFEADVINSAAPVVVDFWAPWCGPCRTIAPALDAISAEMGDKVKIVKVNVDENPKIASNYGIMSIPTLMIFKDGQLVDRKTGAAPQAALKQWISGHA